jgi:hypothetical protein
MPTLRLIGAAASFLALGSALPAAAVGVDAALAVGVLALAAAFGVDIAIARTSHPLPSLQPKRLQCEQINKHYTMGTGTGHEHASCVCEVTAPRAAR